LFFSVLGFFCEFFFFLMTRKKRIGRFFGINGMSGKYKLKYVKKIEQIGVIRQNGRERKGDIERMRKQILKKDKNVDLGLM